MKLRRRKTRNRPEVEITLAMVGSSPDNRILLNGIDLTNSTTGVHVDAEAGGVTSVALELIPDCVRLRVAREAVVVTGSDGATRQIWRPR